MSAFKRNALTFGITFCISILIFGLIAILLMSTLFASDSDNTKKTADTTTAEPDIVPPANNTISNVNKTDFTLMLVGNDYRINGSNTSNADTILLVHFSGTKNEVVYIPIPGNTRTYADGTATTLAEYYDKYASRNPQLLAQKVTSYTGLNIDYYAITNPAGFESMINNLGEFDFEVPKDMKYEDDYFSIDLEAGTRRIDGKTAVKMLRYLGKHTEEENWIARTQLTATFFEAAIDKYINKIAKDALVGKFESLDPSSLNPNNAGTFKTNITDEDILSNLNTIYGYNESNIIIIKIDEFGTFKPDGENGMIFDINDKTALQSRLENYKN